jgi:hypothetical protein
MTGRDRSSGFYEETLSCLDLISTCGTTRRFASIFVLVAAAVETLVLLATGSHGSIPKRRQSKGWAGFLPVVPSIQAFVWGFQTDRRWIFDAFLPRSEEQK